MISVSDTTRRGERKSRPSSQITIRSNRDFGSRMELMHSCKWYKLSLTQAGRVSHLDNDICS